jgi:hypothetical protein
MRLAPNGVIRLSGDLTTPNPKEDTSIQFQFLAGGLHLDAGAAIDVARPARSGQREFILDLGGGDLTGAGCIAGLLNNVSTPRVLALHGVGSAARPGRCRPRAHRRVASWKKDTEGF